MCAIGSPHKINPLNAFKLKIENFCDFRVNTLNPSPGSGSRKRFHDSGILVPFVLFFIKLYAVIILYLELVEEVVEAGIVVEVLVGRSVEELVGMVAEVHMELDEEHWELVLVVDRVVEGLVGQPEVMKKKVEEQVLAQQKQALAQQEQVLVQLNCKNKNFTLYSHLGFQLVH
jgi:hypothetical protein